MDFIVVTIDEFAKVTGVPATTVRQYFYPDNKQVVNDAKKQFYPDQKVHIVKDDDERKLRLPSLMRRASNLAGAAARNVERAAKGQQLRVPSQVQQDRFQVCLVCNYFKSDTAECTKCGCKMALKTRLASEECPVKKWEAYDGPDVTPVQRADRRRNKEQYNGVTFVYPVEWPDYRVEAMKAFLNEANVDLITKYYPGLVDSLQAFRRKPNCGSCRKNIVDVLQNEDEQERIKELVSRAVI